jgi:hypothetical protein
MGKSWSDSAVRYLVDEDLCPRCDAQLRESGWCRACGADLAGPVAVELSAASSQAADALAARQHIIGRLPTTTGPAAWRIPAPVQSGSPATSPLHSPAGITTTVTTTTPVDAPPSAASRPAYQAPVWAATGVAAAPRGPNVLVTVPSVLSVAGAALFAVAALVFTFLNPDLTSFAGRTTIIGVITVVFLGGAWFFARSGLQFSAESVGALGGVFVLLDVWAISQLAPLGVSPFVFASVATLGTSAGLMFIGSRARVRTWVWTSVVGLALTPGLFGAAGGSAWSAVLGSLCVAAIVLGLSPLVRRLAPRFGTALGVERGTALVIQVAAVAVSLVQLAVIDVALGAARVFGTAGILACLAVVAALGSRNGLPRFWSFTAGALAVAAVALLPLALTLPRDEWLVALLPLFAGAALVGVTALSSTVAARPAGLRAGAGLVALVAAVPALFIAGLQLVSPIFTLMVGVDSRGPDSVIVSPILGLATLGGVAAAAGTLWALSGVSPSRLEPTEAAPTEAAPTEAALSERADAAAVALRRRGRALAGLMLVLLTTTGWNGFDRPVQATVGLLLAVTLSVVLIRVPRVTQASAALRVPLVVGAHLQLVLAATVGWIQPATTVWVGAAAVLALVAVAHTRPAAVRPLYFGVGYAYALVVFASALDLARVESIAVLCLTTTLALLFALTTTLTTWLSPRSWYAALIVTSVPFLTGVVGVLIERSGWTALSTGIAFALALTLLVTRRPGITLLLRSTAAALLVPALAVLVVCLGAQLPMSGSPIVLPIVAAIVAVTIPLAPLIANALTRLGISIAEADAARFWIEIAAGVTAVLAVLLALVRVAAGLETTFLVLVILGAGAAASALTTHHRYAWWAAGACWTGALWCVWALQGVNVLEPYVLPPALTAVIVGAWLTHHGRDGGALYTTGLLVAVVPTLAVLIVSPGGVDVTTPWRSSGLLAGALLLIALGRIVMQHPSTAQRAAAEPATGLHRAELRTLRAPTLWVATIAAGAGAVQAVRWGLGLDLLDLAADALVMLPVLGLTLLTVSLAVGAGYVLQAVREVATTGGPAYATVPSRWRYAAATAFLVAGPITAIRPDPVSIITLMALTLALLGFLLITVWLARSDTVSLPPAWFIFTLAWCAAVAGWSERELRVEAWSLPLGVALLLAGVLTLGPTPEGGPARPTGVQARGLRTWAAWTAWPIGFSGSWRLLTPGLVVIFLPSVLATGTDPLTWRAIMVMSLALAAIVIGSVRRLAAPFVLSLAVLPIEIIVVFMVQIGRTINPLLWWIALAVAGAVLLVIAITSERKGSRGTGTAARLRDLT